MEATRGVCVAEYERNGEIGVMTFRSWGLNEPQRLHDFTEALPSVSVCGQSSVINAKTHEVHTRLQWTQIK